MKPRRSTLSSTQQAKRKLVVHFLGKVLPPYRSGILQRVREKCNRVWANFFYNFFTRSFLEKAPLWTLEFDSCPMRPMRRPS